MLTQSCEQLPGVGPALAKKLSACGIHNIQDLLFHLPYRYQDRTHITPIQDLRANDWCVVMGKICKVEVTQGRRMMLNCFIEDKTGLLKLRFFHFNRQQIMAFNDAPMIRAFGQIREFSNPFEMIHPEYKIINANTECTVEETLTPIYPTTHGLTQNKIRNLIQLALSQYKTTLDSLEWMHEDTLEHHCFLPLSIAITHLHMPPPDTSFQLFENGSHPGLKRLVFDELLAQRLSMQFARQQRAKLRAPAFKPSTQQIDALLSVLPFNLTNAQTRVHEEIKLDISQNKPMLRLVQGDVGSGKTVIAALAALHAITNGYQAALMAPTDLLSEQHAQTLTPWFNALGITVLRLTGKMKTRERSDVLTALATHQCQLVIGTHALFQEAVAFARLGLIIIDEQHRFGVEQRAQLQQKGQTEFEIPHQLLMTATPIPRTLAMSQFAHLDISAIDELPPGRTPVITAVLSQDKRETVINRLQMAITSGRQAYWVCTLIDESEKLQCIAATETTARLQAQLPDVRIGLVHGRLKPQEKEATMAAFKQGELDLLVATTVIEVGVNVPNASLMIIENAERLGLSQLHQLRGRVGRGNTESHCLLLYQSPLSHHSAERLRIMRKTTDGFIISEKDLELRGAGEVLGTRQTGYRQYKIADLSRDAALLPLLKKAAEDILNKNPDTAYTITKRWLGDFEIFFQS